MGKELQIGKRYTWDEVVAAYPDKWVRMNDCTLGWGDSIIDGILAGVYNDDDDTDDIWLEVFHGRNDSVAKNNMFCRTTMGMGFIDCLNAKMEVHDAP